jgi:type I restriction enzyme S subunit
MSKIPLRRFRPYPEYRNSGVGWLGQIPARWETLQFRRLLHSIEQGWSPIAEDRQAGEAEWAVIKLSAINSGEFRSWEHKALPSGVTPIPELEIKEHDLLLTRSNTPSSVGDVCFVRNTRSRLMFSDLVYRLKVDSARIDNDFLTYWLLSLAGRHQIRLDARGASGSMVKVAQSHIKTWFVLVPPIDDQRAIATFLGCEMSKIDALVSKKERLIELLQEKRSGLITRTVTKGIIPSVAMMDSRVGWLGDVPAHWKRCRMSYLVTMISGGTPSKDTPEYWRGRIPWVSPKDMKVRIISDAMDHVSEKAVSDTGLVIVQPPALLIVVRGMILAHTFPVAYTIAPVTVNQDMKALHLATNVDANYFAYLLEGMSDLVLSLVEEAGHGTKCLRTDLWRAIEIYLPPQAEQIDIAAFLDRELGRLKGLVDRISDAISRLQDLRAALITATVTGKIDVREEA